MAALVVALGLAVWLGPVLRQKMAVADIRNLGGEVHYSGECDSRGLAIPGALPRGPEWIRRWLGDDFFDCPAAVHFYDSPAPVVSGDDLVKRLGELKGLRSIGLSRGALSTAGLAPFSQLGELRVLYLHGTVLDGGDLDALCGLPLDWLCLARTRVSDRGLGSLAGMHALRYLDLTRTRVTDKGLRHLEGLVNLDRLILRRTKVTEAGAAALRAKLVRCTIEWEPLHGEGARGRASR